MRDTSRSVRSVLGTVLLVASMLPSATADACTTFLLDGTSPLVGKSYDWDNGRGLVVFNKEGVSKAALPIQANDKPVTWTSRYASLTFNQFGRELPNGGMNTAGLIVEILWLRSAKYPKVDARPSINELQWIQYNLDRFSTVAEVIEHADALRISAAYANVHYMVCDATATCAAVEYLGGELVISTGERMSDVKVLTNNTYADSRRALDVLGRGETPSSTRSLDRFMRAARLSSAAASPTTDRAFAILDRVSMGAMSQWKIVYDPKALRVFFRTATSPAIKHVDLARFDRRCASPVRVLDIDSKASGDVFGRFVPYRDEVNAELIRASTRTLDPPLPQGATEALATLPHLTVCR